MAEARLDGLRVVVVGAAEAALVDATVAAFDAVGADTMRVADDELGSVARPDICICFARGRRGRGLDEVDPAGFDEAVQVALLRPQWSAMTAARRMADGGGAIVIVGSVDATHAYPGRAAASVAMGGLLGLVRSMAVELSAARIRANLVLAGPLGGADGAPRSDDVEIVERTLLRSPVQRLGRPEEVAAAIRFVAGPDAGFMTGQTIRVDGGWASLNQTPEGMRFP